MSTSGVGATSGSSSTSKSKETDFKNKSLEDTSVEDFLKLLLTQLQQQDPMNPMDNAQMMQQISQIREIQSNTHLTETLESVGLGQSISTASSLIGKTIKGLTAKGDKVEGKVDSVTITDSKPVLHVGDKEVPVNNISDIQPTTSSSS